MIRASGSARVKRFTGPVPFSCSSQRCSNPLPAALEDAPPLPGSTLYDNGLLYGPEGPERILKGIWKGHLHHGTLLFVMSGLRSNPHHPHLITGLLAATPAASSSRVGGQGGGTSPSG